MIECEGYKAFSGTATVNTVHGGYTESGDWLYKPEYDCWYCNGESFPASCISDIQEVERVFWRDIKYEFKALREILLTVENREEVVGLFDRIMERWGLK